MAVETTNVNWLYLVMSSAVISAMVNIGWSAYLKRVERQQEEKKDKQRIGLIYLDIALELEAFAKRCEARLYDIQNGLCYYDEHHDATVLNQLKPFTFAFEPEPKWSELPIFFVAKVRVLPSQFQSTNDWIIGQSEWVDHGDSYRSEEERVAYYGLKVCEIASDIRRDIQVGEGETENYLKHLRSLIEKRREMFKQGEENVTLIPELQTQFNKEITYADSTNNGPTH